MASYGGEDNRTEPDTYLKYSAEHYVRVKNNYLVGAPDPTTTTAAPPAHQG